MFDLTPQEKKILIILGAFAVLGLSVLAYRTYFARPKLAVIHLQAKSSGVHINTADISKIETLPGIGPKLAAEIVAYREGHGSFLLKEDLLKVKGVGKNKFDMFKDLIVLE